MRRIRKSRLTKGKMARQLVYFCIWVLFGVLLWAAAVKTAAAQCGVPKNALYDRIIEK